MEVIWTRSLSDLVKSTTNSSDLARFRPEGFRENRSTIRLKRPQNLSQTDKFSIKFPKSDRLLEILFSYG